MHSSSRLLFLLATVLPQISLAQPAIEKSGATSYQHEVWASLKPVAGGVTAAEIAASARDSSPEVAEADAQIAISAARARQTLSRYAPSLALEASVTRNNPIEYDFSGSGFSVGAQNEGQLRVGNCPLGAANCVLDSAGQPVTTIATESFTIPRNNYTIDATLSIPFSDYVLSLSSAGRGAAADKAAARLQRQAEVNTVDANARIAYYDWLRAKSQLAITQQSLESARLRLEDGVLGLEAGLVTPADKLGLEALVASSAVARVQALSFLRLAKQNLLTVSQWQGPLSIGEDLTQPGIDIETLGTLSALIAHGKQNRAEMRALVARANSQGHASKAAAGALYPRLSGVGNVTHANPNQSFFPPSPTWNTSWFIGVNLSWQLDGFLSTQAQVREFDANTRALRAQQASLARAVELEVRAAWEEWQRADATVRLSDAELTAAEAMHEQRVILFRGGEATSTEVVEAELQRHNATLRKVNARIDKRVALARIRRAAALPMNDKETKP